MGDHKRKTRKRKMRGGIGEEHGFPPCNNLSQFQITDEQLLSFNRTVPSPMECFINALQILGVLQKVQKNFHNGLEHYYFQVTLFLLDMKEIRSMYI